MALSTLPVSSAVLQLDLQDNPVYVFRNAGSGDVNLVYRRPDGNIEWIDPGAPGWLNAEQRDQLLLKQFAHRLPADRWGDVRGWIGLDYVWDQREGPRLIEVNPRLTSSFNLLTNLEFETAPD